MRCHRSGSPKAATEPANVPESVAKGLITVLSIPARTGSAPGRALSFPATRILLLFWGSKRGASRSRPVLPPRQGRFRPLIYRARFLLTMEGPPIPWGCLRVRGDRIIQVGTLDEMDP